MGKHLPILESVAAVALIGAVAIFTALPGSKMAQPDLQASAELTDSLGLLRTAIFRFSMEHDSGEREVLMPGRDSADFVAQLTGPSRRQGTTEWIATPGGHDNRWYGPYLDAIPVNPVNGKNSVRIMPAGYAEPVMNGTAGWVYLPDCGEIFPDLPGVDARGVEYSTY
jgi:hypothetical protein